MQFLPPLESGTLIRRYKRFLADIELANGQQITIHCPNTGAMTGCAEPGFTAYFSTSDNLKRKYPNTFELVKTDAHHFIGINTQNANKIVLQAIVERQIPELNNYDTVESEVKVDIHNSRLDLKLSHPERPACYVEVKSVTLLHDTQTGLGAFPDAVTTRGQKHLQTLMELKKLGNRSVLVLLVQHTGIQNVTVASHIDPVYGQLLAEAYRTGVEILVVHTHIGPSQIIVSHCSQFDWQGTHANN